MTIAPTTTLSSADAWLARFAALGRRAPMRLPTRAEAATPVRICGNERRSTADNPPHTYSERNGVHD